MQHEGLAELEEHDRLSASAAIYVVSLIRSALPHSSGISWSCFGYNAHDVWSECVGVCVYDVMVSLQKVSECGCSQQYYSSTTQSHSADSFGSTVSLHWHGINIV